MQGQTGKDDKYWKGKAVGDCPTILGEKGNPKKAQRIPEAAEYNPFSASGLRGPLSCAHLNRNFMNGVRAVTFSISQIIHEGQYIM